MNPKITAIILFVIGAGLVLWFFNSGDAAKLGSAFSFSNTSSTSSASATSTLSGSATSTKPATTTTATNPIAAFFALLFPPRSTSTIGPSVGSVSDENGETEISQGGGSGSSGSSGSATATSSAGTTFSTASIATSSIPTSSIPTGYTRAQLSPYFHLVRFDGVGTTQITLYTPDSPRLPTSTIDITGWEIKTNLGGEYIPQAVNIYDPESANPESDIILFANQSNYAYLYSNSSPANVRISECMGYLNDTRQFSPAFPDNCPTVASRAQISSFSGQCQNYILSLGGCSTANLQSTQIPRNDYACQQYIENNFTYESCIDNHDHDADFLSDQWRIWTGSTPLDRYHDNVELLDRNGLVVDTYSY